MVTRTLAWLMAAVAVLAIVLLPPFIHWNNQKDHWLSARPTTVDADPLSPQEAFKGLAAYYKINDSEVRPTTLQLTLDNKDLKELHVKRNDALSQGFITSIHKKQLPAALTVDGKRMNASVRLRGNQLDHVTGDKWSLKVYLKQGARFNGIRRFSLQAPYTRSFQSEAIIADAMRRVGVLAPRIDYIDLVINGERIGIMQMTEEFDTPLLESQGRRFGPLIQLDDSHTWEMVRTIDRYDQKKHQKNAEGFDKSAWWNLYSTWQSANPKAYGKYSKRKKGEDLNAALSQWMAFTENRVMPSDIFDVDAFVDFYIICEYFNAHNLANWLNTRLHYNTLTARFEPIAYDADLNFKPMRDNVPLTCLNPRKELARTLMQDHAFAIQWIKRITELDKIIASDQFAKYIDERDKYYRSKLAVDYPSLPEFDFKMAKQQCQRLCRLNIDDFSMPISGGKPLPEAEGILLDDLPPFIKAYIGEDEHGSFLTLRNRIHANAVVNSLTYENQINEQLVPLIDQNEAANSAAQLPVSLRSMQAPTAKTGTEKDARIEIPPATLTEDDSLSLQVNVEGLGTQYTTLKPQPLPRHTAIPQSVPVEMLLQRYSFLTLDKSGNVLQIASGTWSIDDLMILPRDIALQVNAGTQLLFAPNAGIVLYGDLTVNGTTAAPVLFNAADESSGWYGIFSHGVDHRLSIKHATINATRGFEIPGWRQPAGLLIHRANVELENLNVTNSCAKDAINLIRSRVTIKHVLISNSCSDALDIDATSGTLSALQLHQSGGDLLDFSESTVSLSDSEFSGAGDKAISVGEASDVEITEIDISDSIIGLAVKDLSDVKISKAKLASLEIGVMAFQKKAEYGPAVIVAQEIEIDAKRHHVLEENSVFVLQGEELPVTPFDLTDYY